MLTGFLGTGKTTLLRSILDELATREHLADVLLNDRENASIDRETLKDRAANVLALTGSCLCCEGYDELVEMILKASKSQHDLLLIELNGTADPIPLLESFTLLESKFCLRPRWQVCVIDARRFGKRGNFDELEKLQLETASHFTISWSSELSEQEECTLEKKVEAINSQATRTTAPLLADALSQAICNNRHHTFAPKQPNQNHHSSLRFAPTPPPKLRSAAGTLSPCPPAAARWLGAGPPNGLGVGDSRHSAPSELPLPRKPPPAAFSHDLPSSAGRPRE